MVFGTVELGGTKTLVAVGTTPSDLSDPIRIPTTTPEETLEQVVEHLSKHDLEAIGIASFGPVELREDHPDFGNITSTPKPGWSGAPVLRHTADALGVPAGFDTDVNGAALGEGAWGAVMGLHSYVYVTVGTGIGLGAVIRGHTLTASGHPEFGHVVVERHPQDDYPGRCPFHGDCLEGMASGPALEDRFGAHEAWEEPEKVGELAVRYLAQGMRNAVYAYSPQCIVVGGGVSKLPSFHSVLQHALLNELAGYPNDGIAAAGDYLRPPGLGDLSGLAGGLVLAREALG